MGDEAAAMAAGEVASGCGGEAPSLPPPTAERGEVSSGGSEGASVEGEWEGKKVEAAPGAAWAKR